MAEDFGTPNYCAMRDMCNRTVRYWAIGLGWQLPSNPTQFDYLPLMIQLAVKEAKYFDISPEIILVESRGAIMLRPSLLDLDVPVSVYPAPEYL